MPYSRKDVIAAFRADNPDAAHIDDNKIFAAIAVEDPELAKGISELNQPEFKSPVYPGGDVMRTPGQVATDQARNVITGLPQAVTSIPGAAWELGGSIKDAMLGRGSERGRNLVAGAIKGTVDPLVTAGKGAMAIGATEGFPAREFAEANPENPAYPEAAQAGGAALAGAVIPPAVGLGTKAAIARLRATKIPQQLKTMAATNTAKVLQPTTKEMRGVTQKIAPAIAEEGIEGLGGKAQDAHILKQAEAAGKEVQAQRARVAKSTKPIMRSSLSGPVDDAIKRLKVEGTEVTGNPEALAELERMRAQIRELPDTLTVKQLLDYGDQLDDRVSKHGGFGATGADNIKVAMTRGVSNVVRAAKNQIDTVFAKANKRYSLWKNAADIVEERQLGQVGKTGTGIPGRGTILDDILATWAGNAIGGPVAGAGAEAVNLIRQSRLWSNIKAKGQMGAARIIEGPQVPKDILATNPARLLTPGNRQMPMPGNPPMEVTSAMPDLAPATREIRTGRLLEAGAPLPPPSEAPSGMSPMEVTTGDPLIRGYGDLIPVGDKRIPRIPKTGAAKGMTLTNVIPDEITGQPKIWVYTEVGSGKQLKFTTPQK